MVPSDRHVKELDGLRGIAVLLVLGWHFTGMLMNPSDGPFQNAVWRFSVFGQSGVDLFFVLSGFLIFGILADNRGATALIFFRTFYIRRALRIMPPYLLLVTAFASCTAIFGSSYYLGRQLPLVSPDVQSELGHVRHSRIWACGHLRHMVACDRRKLLHFCPGLGVSLPGRFLWPALLTIGATSGAARSFYFALHPDNVFAPYVLPPLRLDGLCAGGLVALVYRSDESWRMVESRKELLLVIAMTLLAAAPVYTWMLRTDRAHAVLYHFGHSYLTVLYCTVLINVLLRIDSAATSWLRAPLLTGAGTISYSLYLFHTPFKGVFFLLSGHNEQLRTWTDAALLAALLSTIAFCATLYRIVEKPAQRLGKRFSYLTPKNPLQTVCPTQQQPFELSRSTAELLR
jgi:peptidoglycan/LPS O-acetylase OafA/YrhL